MWRGRVEDLRDVLDADYHLKEINLDTKEEHVHGVPWLRLLQSSEFSPQYSPEPGASE